MVPQARLLCSPWEECSKALKRAFPKRKDLLATLKEMVGRKKQVGETMSRYYHSKFALCEAVEIIGEDAVSCIIYGLPEELQANPRAYKCSTNGRVIQRVLGK